MPTKVFISWSGELSKKLGEALRDWLPKALQSVKPYFSPNDIEKGTRWDAEVAGELEASDIGIICVTPDNTERPWILFEAGALSKAMDKACVCPLLFGLKAVDLSGPLGSFQHTEFGEVEFRKLVGTINNALGEAKLDEKVLDGVFEKWWPDLETAVSEIHTGHEKESGRKPRETRDLVEETFLMVRALTLDRSGSRPAVLSPDLIDACTSALDLWNEVGETLDSFELDTFCNLWLSLGRLCRECGVSGLYGQLADLACAKARGEPGRVLADRLRQVEETERQANPLRSLLIPRGPSNAPA